MKNPTKIKRILRNINLSQHPSLNHKAEELFAFGSHQDWVTLGDAHANPLKILYFLIAMGVVQFKNTQDQVAAYARFHDYCLAQIKFAMDCEHPMYQAGLTPIEPMRFSELGNFLEVAPGSKFRAGGDELADRWLTGDDSVLGLLAEFQVENGQLETILSNHVLTFIQLFEYAHIEYCKQRISNEAIEKCAYDGYLALVNLGDEVDDISKDNAYQIYTNLVAKNKEQADTVFIDAFASACDTYATMRTWDANQNIWVEDRSFYASAHTLSKKLQLGVMTVDELFADYERHKKTFKVFSYDYVELHGKPRIYSHADTSRYNVSLVTSELYSDNFFTDEERAEYEIIRDLNPHLDHIQTYEDLEPYETIPLISNQHLYQCIDLCNRVLKTQADKNKMSVLFSTHDGNSTALTLCVENRDNTRDRTIHNIHGHDPKEHNDHHESLDDLSGKERHDDERKRLQVEYYRGKHPEPEAFVYGMAYTKTPATRPEPANTSQPLILRGRKLTKEEIANKNRGHAPLRGAQKGF